MLGEAPEWYESARNVRSAWRTARLRGSSLPAPGLLRRERQLAICDFAPNCHEIYPSYFAEGTSRPGAGVDTSSKHTIMAPAEWTRQEQQLLQAALRQNPPSMENTARWEAIAAAVPGRGPQECLDQLKLEQCVEVKGVSPERFYSALARSFLWKLPLEASLGSFLRKLPWEASLGRFLRKLP